MIFRKGLLILTLVLAGLILIVLAFAGDALFGNALRRYGPPAIGQPLDFDEARLSLLQGSVGIDGLLIGTQKRQLAKFGTITFDASTTDLLAGRLHIEEAAINRAHFNLEIDKNGKLMFDPGPPPEGTPETAPESEQNEGEVTPPEDRDLVQIVEEYWQRYQTYKEYYDKYGSVFSGSEEGEEGSDDGSEQRIAHPGKPEYLKHRPKADSGSGFWLAKAEITEFSWTTLDHRTGKPILPPIKKGTLSLLNMGTPLVKTEATPGAKGAAAASGDAAKAPGSAGPGPATVHAEATLVDGGKFLMSLRMPHGKGPTRLDVELLSLPIDALAAVLNKSIPYDVTGGMVDLLSKNVRFSDQSLRGTIHLEMRNVVLAPRKNSKAVLGIKPADFCKVLNAGMKDHPVAFDFVLGGTPTDPTFKIQNATNLEDLILDALTDEAKARVQAEIDKQKAKLEEKKDELKEKAKDKLGDKAKDLLGDKKPDLGKLFGGKDGG